MKIRLTVTILLFAILTAILITAGCTQPGPSVQPSAGPAVTPTPANMTTIGDGLLLFDKSKFSSFEYEIFASDGNTNVRVGNIKTEYDTAPYGNITDARHMREVRALGEGNQTKTIVTDLYFKPVNNWILGGHTSTTTATGTIEKDIPENDPAYWNYDMATISANVKFIDGGTEPVAIPRGFFPAAKKYTSVDSGISLWMANGIPVPVKISGASQYEGTVITTTMELVSYA